MTELDGCPSSLAESCCYFVHPPKHYFSKSIEFSQRLKAKSWSPKGYIKNFIKDLVCIYTRPFYHLVPSREECYYFAFDEASWTFLPKLIS